MDKEISSEKVDIEKIMDNIREKTCMKKDISVKSDVDFGMGPKMDSFLPANYGQPMECLNNYETSANYLISINQVCDPREDSHITSHRKIIGPVIVLLKKALRKMLKFFCIPNILLSKQAEINSNMVNLLNYLAKSLNVKDSFLSKKVMEIRQENILLKQRLNRILTEIEKIHHFPDKGVDSLVREKNNLMDHNYFLFEKKYRGTEEEIKNKQQRYISLFRGKDNVLDIGCGRGEFLKILRREGIKASGIDINEDMIYVCKEKKLDAIQIDALTYLASINDDSLGGIFASHVIEHFTIDLLTEFLRLCLTKLKKGGYAVFETPNPLSMVSATNFYRDLSHIKPLHPDAIKFLTEANGFVDVQIRYLSPFPDEMKLQEINEDPSSNFSKSLPLELLNNNIHKLNSLLYGYQDYAIISKKDKG